MSRENDLSDKDSAPHSNGRRPRIGITACVENTNFGAWKDIRASFIPFTFVEAVEKAGGLTVILTPDEESVKDPHEILSFVDALILSGGGDVHPQHYGHEPHPKTTPVEELRDRYELALAEAAVEADLPVLGICRGMQVLNVAYGGTLAQHLPDVLGHNGHKPVPGEFAPHEVRLAPGTLAEQASGEAITTGMSSHHQGVAEIGEGLKVTGWATIDEHVEAIEDPQRTFVLGVQWHSEVDPESQIIANLVDEARQRMETSSR